MKKLAITAICLLTLAAVRAAQSNLQDTVRRAIVTDPSIARSCDVLLEKRKQKLKHRQRLSFLAERNKKLKRATPVRKVSIKTKLNDNMRKIINELKMTNLKIENIEEKIIRRGCPGLSL